MTSPPHGPRAPLPPIGPPYRSRTLGIEYRSFAIGVLAGAVVSWLGIAVGLGLKALGI